MIEGDCEVETDRDWVNVCNYKIIEKCQEFHPKKQDIKILLEAAKADICSTISLIKYHTYAVGYIVEEMCCRGFLNVPNSLEKLGMYAVLK